MSTVHCIKHMIKYMNPHKDTCGQHFCCGEGGVRRGSGTAVTHSLCEDVIHPDVCFKDHQEELHTVIKLADLL